MLWKILAGLAAVGMLLGGINTIFIGGDAWAMFAVDPMGAEGASTIRGDIGGMFLTSGIITALGLYKKRPDFLLVIGVMMLVIAGGRAVGLVLDGYAQQPLTFLIVEVVLFAILFMASRTVKA